KNCTFSSNSAAIWGGGIYNNYNTEPELINCTFIDNSAGDNGGGMFNNQISSPKVTNSVFIGNSADYGGGMGNNDNSNPTMTNCTISFNSATYGGGMANDNSNPTVTNCIFWGNDSTISDNEIYNEGTSTPTVRTSDIGGCGGSGSWDSSMGIDGGGNIDADPYFVDAAGGDWNLQGISQCIDSGNNDVVTEATDREGKARLMDGDFDAIPTVEMGAYEYERPMIVYGDIIFVDQDAGGSNTGLNWDDALLSLQNAINVASAGQAIWVAEGTYTPVYDYELGLGERGKHFRMKNQVAIYGGFVGNEPNTFNLNDRDLVAHETILSGDIGTPMEPNDNCYHVFYHPVGTYLNTTAVLDGFTITSGHADMGSEPHDRGGGMYNYFSSPKVLNCTFRSNWAYNGGGMVNDVNSSPEVIGCTFSDNTTDSYGGGIHNGISSNPILTDCTFSGNTAVNGSGGGMSNYSNSPILFNCTFNGNTADAAYGGGLYNYWECSPIIINCVFSGNSADAGGGMYDRASNSSTIFNCTFAGNLATNGKALACDSSGQEYPGAVTMVNSICWDGGAEIWSYDGSSITITYSDIQGGWAGPGGDNIDADPNFVDAAGGDVHLLGISPCIDHGDNSEVIYYTDRDGIPRYIDADFNGIPTVDMGAYEHVPPAVVYEDIIYVDQDATDGGNTGLSWDDALLSLQYAMSVASAGQAIWVAEGTYTPVYDYELGLGARGKHFRMKNQVAIYGGFAGNEPDIFDLNDRDLVANETILSGDLNGNDESGGDNSDNCFHVIFNPGGLDPNTILDGFTVTGGNANGSVYFNSGGGMYNICCSSTVTNCIFSGNTTTGHGGGMFNLGTSSPIVANCNFRGNSASKGGGMFNESSRAIITNCIFSGNSSDFGGGIYNFLCDPNVTNCTFSSNSATWYGGGMHNDSQVNPTVTGCIFWGNSAPSDKEISGPTTVRYSCVEGGYAGMGNMDGDPLFMDADGVDNIVGTADDDLHLKSYSPCIDGGEPAGDYSGQADCDGESRVRYDCVDIGADEVYAIAGDFEEDEDVDMVDLSKFYSHWLDSPCSGAYWCGGADFNTSGEVNLIDYAFLANHWLKGSH
ncbi:MAG: right-handed parallel beta-helix repeat-containing protein, partial [Planctomycetes bacterium]|nr:right-handed parallel beta-helix repeat-containing protein [Planctomycetota bacterium]